jgi:hypothetical protein
MHPRSLWGQTWLALLQPGIFFNGMPAFGETRSWLWAAILILALVGFSAVRQEALQNGGGLTPAVPSIPPDLGGGPGGVPGGVVPLPSGGGGAGFTAAPLGPGPGGDPGIPGGPGDVPVTGNGGSPTATWTTALIEASHILLGWFILSLILVLVPMFNGYAPRLGINFQIAIWSSLPLGVMAALQLVYWQLGGPVKQPGFSGFLAEWKTYQTLPVFWQSVALSLVTRGTIFWLWNLALIYIGARRALSGKIWAVLLALVAWVVVLVIVPVATGAIAVKPKDEPINLEALQPGSSLVIPGNIPAPDQPPTVEAAPAGETPLAPNPTGETTPEATPSTFFSIEGTPNPEATLPADPAFSVTTPVPTGETTPEATPNMFFSIGGTPDAEVTPPADASFSVITPPPGLIFTEVTPEVTPGN